MSRREWLYLLLSGAGIVALLILVQILIRNASW